MTATLTPILSVVKTIQITVTSNGNLDYTIITPRSKQDIVFLKNIIADHLILHGPAHLNRLRLIKVIRYFLDCSISEAKGFLDHTIRDLATSAYMVQFIPTHIREIREAS